MYKLKEVSGFGFGQFQQQPFICLLYTSVAYIVGLTVIEALTASYVYLTTPLSLTYGDSVIKLQEILDQILHNMLPLGATLLCSYLMRRKNFKAQTLIVAVMVVGIIGGVLGIFG